jgi:hypothetical protein
MRKFFTTLILLGSFILQPLAYPISPQPLRKLVMESPFIIVGQVKKIEKVKSGEYPPIVLHRAVIYPLEVLQGDLEAARIEVVFNPGMICPAPPVYIANTTVLAFLEKKLDGYRTHALSYGAKTLDEPALDVYRARIKEMQAILKMEDEKEQRAATVEWLVKCVEEKATRWEGAYELMPESDFMSFYDQDLPDSYALALSASQRERLKKVLLEDDYLDYEDFGLVDLVMPGNEEKVTDWLENQMLKLDESNFWLADFIMKRITKYNPDPELKAIFEAYLEIEDTFIDYLIEGQQSQTDKLISQFRNRLALLKGSEIN